MKYKCHVALRQSERLISVPTEHFVVATAETERLIGHQRPRIPQEALLCASDSNQPCRIFWDKTKLQQNWVFMRKFV